MQFLRNARQLVYYTLVWFALSIGVAGLSPLVNAQDLQLVCSSAGVMKFVASGDADAASTGLKLDCPLCLGVVAPPPVSTLSLVSYESLVYALPRYASNHLILASAASLPARGPPGSI